MEMKNLEPKILWDYFYQINQIPRPSKHEEKMTAFLKNFGEGLKLETTVDEAGNVIIRKGATTGNENKPGVVLQAHMDMVCEKNNDTVHNFETDPIQAYVDGEWIKAKGTTLGGDDGIGCATMMAILASNDMSHPKLECLFTVDEETGLTGAFALKPNVLKGDYLINLDSEDDAEFFIGCAGGLDTTVDFTYKPEAMPDDLFYFKVKVSGLNGGHSGDDIDKGLGCANKILNRFLWQTARDTELSLSIFDGGNLSNAIAREGHAIAAVPKQFKETLAVKLNIFASEVESELAATEKNFKMELSSCPKPATRIDKDTANRLMNSLYACPHGVIRMSDEMKGMVETSTNLAAVKTLENTIHIVTSQRSSVESSKQDISNMVESVFILAGAKATHGDGYPGWKPNPKSPIANILAETYRRLFNDEPKIKSIHAGLECGLFSTKYPNLDMVSVGPTMRGVHSPDERLHIAHTQKFWKLIVDVLAHIK